MEERKITPKELEALSKRAIEAGQADLGSALLMLAAIERSPALWETARPILFRLKLDLRNHIQEAVARKN